MRANLDRDHDNTATTRRVQKIERQLKRLLKAIYGEVKRDTSIASGIGVSFTAVRQSFEAPSRDIIRAGITEIYIEAARYVTVLSNGLPFFMTETDTQLMRKLSEEFSQYYWQGLENEFVKKLSTAFDPKTLARLPASRLSDSFVDRFVESLGSRVTSEATLSKTQQIEDRIALIQTRSGQLIPEGYDPLEFLALYQPTSFAVQFFLEGERRAERKLIFMSARDERVCPICAPLHGKVFDAGDPNIPLPVAHTHLRCRCRLMLYEPGTGAIMK